MSAVDPAETLEAYRFRVLEQNQRSLEDKVDRGFDRIGTQLENLRTLRDAQMMEVARTSAKHAEQIAELTADVGETKAEIPKSEARLLSTLNTRFSDHQTLHNITWVILGVVVAAATTLTVLIR